jgi:thiamine biosynthesis protein ThiI
MKFIVKLFPEITIKSKPVRKQFVRQLRLNLKKLMRTIDESIEVTGFWDKIEIDSQDVFRDQIIDLLQRVPGIANIQTVTLHEFETFDDILACAKTVYEPLLEGKRFVVRVKRVGKHSFKSGDVERYVGGGLLQHTLAKSVDLHHSEITVKIEIRNDKLYIIERRYEGLGGFPLGCLDAVMSLISGGFDSTVSSYLTMKRGMRTHFCFFNLGGAAHEIGVKQVSHYLWERYGASHRIKFVTIPFEEVVAELLRNVHHSMMGVVLKRMMLRAASKVATDLGVQTLVTGESVAQVSSQTLANLGIIDQACDMLTLRPLITMDKNDIIRISTQIGTEDYAKNMPEYCGVISDRPTTRARLDKIEHEESRFDMSVLERAVADSKAVNIDEVLDAQVSEIGEVEIVSTPAVEDIIIDIRAPYEEEKSPLHLTNNQILKMPFYELSSKTTEIEPNRRYLLYCDKGTMSQLHAGHLKMQGFNNVLVYKA